MNSLCAHVNAEPVDDLTGETVAALCPDCEHQLPARWLDCDHENSIDTTMINDLGRRNLCNGCGVQWMEAL